MRVVEDGEDDIRADWVRRGRGLVVAGARGEHGEAWLDVAVPMMITVELGNSGNDAKGVAGDGTTSGGSGSHPGT